MLTEIVQRLRSDRDIFKDAACTEPDGEYPHTIGLAFICVRSERTVRKIRPLEASVGQERPP